MPVNYTERCIGNINQSVIHNDLIITGKMTALCYDSISDCVNYINDNLFFYSK